jgi:predicted nucleotidyltransferase component of viral defense system
MLFHHSSLDFPTIIEAMPFPKLLVYTPESAVSEKFEAIVKLGHANSRMKDFYDIYYLAQHYEFKAGFLKEAMLATFNNRQTQLADRNYIYQDDYMLNSTKEKQWTAFKMRIQLEDTISFADCIQFIKTFIEPLFDETKSFQKWDTALCNWH